MSVTTFPPGWTLHNTQNGSGIAGAIQAPSMAGVTHVLDSLFVKFASTNAAAAATTIQVQIQGTQTLTFLLVLPGAVIASDTLTLDGLNLTSQPGGALVVIFLSPCGAGYWQEITAQGHDI
jgi:hypothetical protein